MQDFRDATVVVTGAAAGMGAAYARAFARRGARLALCDVRAEPLEALARELGELIGHARVLAQAVDVADRAAVFAFAEEVREALGPAHVVINNAGIGGVGRPFYHVPLEEFDRTMRVNFDGVVNGTRAFLPHLVARGRGALVNVSSVFGLVGPPNATDYAAAKFAVRGFTEALMAEFYGSGIQVHCLHPGGVRTDIGARSGGDDRFAAEKLTTPPEDVAEHVIKCIRKGRLKIVYGNESRRVWLGANLLPLKLFIRQLWRETGHLTDTTEYADFNPARTGSALPPPK